MYIAFYLGTKQENPHATWVDRLICWVTESRYSHVEIVTAMDISTYVGNKSWSSSPRDGGVRSTQIDFASGRWDVYRVDTLVTEYQVNEWFMRRRGAKYDWLGAISTQMPLNLGRPLRWFCSEAVAASMDIDRPHMLSPCMLWSHLLQTHSTKLVVDGATIATK